MKLAGAPVTVVFARCLISSSAAFAWSEHLSQMKVPSIACHTSDTGRARHEVAGAAPQGLNPILRAQTSTPKSGTETVLEAILLRWTVGSLPKTSSGAKDWAATWFSLEWERQREVCD
jgi:hypothetical protein